MEVVSSTSQIPARKGDEVQICLHIMNMFHLLPASTFRLFEPLLILALKGEKALGIEVCVCVYVCMCVRACVLITCTLLTGTCMCIHVHMLGDS